MSMLPWFLTRVITRLVHIAAVAAAVLVVALLCVVWYAHQELARLQTTLRPRVEQALSTQLGRGVRIDGLRLRGLNQLVFSGIAIARGDSFANGTWATAPEARADIDLLSFAFHPRQNPVDAVRGISVSRPTAAVQRDHDGRWNIQDIVTRLQAHPPHGGARLQVEVTDGQLAVDDLRGFGQTHSPFRQRFAGIRGTLSSRGAGRYVFLASAGNDALRRGTVRVAGEYAGTGESRVSVRADAIDVNQIAPQLASHLPITFKDGTAALRLVALFDRLPKNGATPSPSALTVEVDLSGVGLRLRELATPIMATSGRLRLVHNRAHYPHGSRLEFINVRAEAGTIPVTLAGTLSELNLFDLANARPTAQLTVTAEGDGTALQQLFVRADWLQQASITGRTRLLARISGQAPALRIDGTLDAAGLAIAGVRADVVRTDFRLFPNVRTTGGQTSLQAAARIERIVAGDATYSDLRLALHSDTAWRQLVTDPQLRGSAAIARARMPWGDATDIRAQLTVNRDGARLDQLSAGLFGGTVSDGTLAMPLTLASAQPLLAGQVAYHGLLLRTLAQSAHIPDLAGRADGTLTFTLEPSGRLRLATDMTARDVTFQGKRAERVAGTLRVLGQDNRVEIDIPRVQAQTEYGTFTITDGRYLRVGDAPAEGTLHLPVRGSGIALARFSDTLTGTATLEGLIAGTPDVPVLTGHAVGADGTVLGRAFTRAESDLVYSARALRLRNTTLSRPGMTARVIDDGTGIDPRGDLHGLTATLELHGAPVNEVLALLDTESPWPITGGTRGLLDVRYTAQGLELGGAVAIPDALVQIPQNNSTYPLRLARLGLTFDYADRQMQVRDLMLERGKTVLHARGTVGAPEGEEVTADLAFSGAGGDLADLPQDLFGIQVPLAGAAEIAGTVRGALSGKGTQPLLADVTLASTQVTIAGVPVGQGDADMQYQYQEDTRTLLVRHGTLAHAAFRAEAAGRVGLSARTLDGFTLNISDIDLTKAAATLGQPDLPVTLALPDGLAGHGTLRLSADGPFAKPKLTASIDLTALALGSTPLPDVRGRLRSEEIEGRYALRIDELTAARGGMEFVRASGLVEPGRRVDVQVNVHDLTTAVLSPWVAGLPAEARASFTGALRGPWQAPVLDGDAQLEHPHAAVVDARGHLRLDSAGLTLADGRVTPALGGVPVSLRGTLPVRLSGTGLAVDGDSPIALNVTVPTQPLAAFRALMPASVTEVTGTVDGALTLGGTMSRPRIADGRVQLHGAVGLKDSNAALANRVQDVILSATMRGNRVTLDRLSARLTRTGKGAGNFKPGTVAAAGTVEISDGMLRRPQQWQWDVCADVRNLSLPESLMVVPHTSGALHLVTRGQTPMLEGVFVLEDMKLREPKTTTGGAGWGPFALDPRLRIAVLVGKGVKVKKSIFSMPLQPTPLPLPAWSETGLTAVSFVPYDTMLDRMGTRQETAGTWGAITGSLADPNLYARFQVHKEKLAFPLNLIGSVRHARGHVTYNLANGPQIVMGIPDFPEEKAATTPAPSGSPSTGGPGLSLR